MTAMTDQQAETVPQTMPQLPLMGQLGGVASVNMAYGTPIVANGRSIIPVAIVATRLGGGFGRGRVRSLRPPTDGQHTDSQAEKQPGLRTGGPALVEVVKDRVPAQNLMGKELFGGQFTPLTPDRRTGLFSAGEKCIRQFR